MDKNVAHSWFGEVAQSIAPLGIMMAIFMLIYSVWFGLAWVTIVWLGFGVTIVLAAFLIIKSIQNIRHAKKFPVNESEAGKKIGKSRGVLSGISYGYLLLSSSF